MTLLDALRMMERNTQGLSLDDLRRTAGPMLAEGLATKGYVAEAFPDCYRITDAGTRCLRDIQR